MRERLPKTAEVFLAGDIDHQAFSTIVSRTDLIVEPDALARVDELVAVNVVRWPSLTRGRLAAKIDAIVARVDADAVRRRKERQLIGRSGSAPMPTGSPRSRQPVHRRRPRPGQTVERVGGHGV